MAFTTTISTCEEKAALNDWVSGQADAGSRECVAAVKKLTGAPQTSLWRRGIKVKGNNIVPGTAIATFPIMLGNGDRFRFKGHSAIFVEYTAKGIWVYDQYPSPAKPFGKRKLEYLCSSNISNDAEAFFVIELEEVPSGEPALCHVP